MEKWRTDNLVLHGEYDFSRLSGGALKLRSFVGEVTDAPSLACTWNYSTFLQTRPPFPALHAHFRHFFLLFGFGSFLIVTVEIVKPLLFPVN